MTDQSTPNAMAFYGGRFLKSCDLDNGPLRLAIEHVYPEVIGSELGTKRRLVCDFLDFEKSLVLNATNARLLADHFGSDYTHWFGEMIELYTVDTQFAGRGTKGIRVRIPTPS